MQKFYILIVCALFCCANVFSQEIVETNYYKQHPELGGSAVITSQTKSAKGKDTQVSFAVMATQGDFFANFWVCPTKLSDGSYANYKVSVNGKEVGNLQPTTSDWQYISLGRSISLSEGENRVTITGIAPDLPNIEHVYFSSENVKPIDDTVTEYASYKIFVENESRTNAQSNLDLLTTLGTDTLFKEDAIMPLATSESPLYDYNYELNATIYYTFYKMVSFTQGQQIFLSTNGVDNFSHIIEFFSSSKPSQYSWSAMSNSNCMASLIVTIPESGLYYVRVRSYLNARSGLCNLNINGENYYENIPVYSLGVRTTQGTDQVYNSFTCSNTGDPRIWIEEGSSIPGKIFAYNDDYVSQGTYSWGRNARIKMQYSRPVHAVLLSSYSSYNPRVKCDLYVKCKKGYTGASFPQLKEDDAISSSPASSTYNCISWSGGITSYWEWPASSFSSYYSSNPLTAFDNFYASRGLTRVGATASNSVVDLWAYVNNGNRSYKHASVRKGADNFAHGYDWESKLGSLMRIFHPREALTGDAYGQIVEHYIKTSTSTQTLEEEIADGTSIIEYVDFNEDENRYIAQKEASINSGVLSEFEKLYSRWNGVVTTSIMSNPDEIANCAEYRDLLTFCQSNEELRYVVFKKLGESDVAAMKLTEDMTLKGNEMILEDVRSSMVSTQDLGIKVIRPVLSNAIDFVKRLLNVSSVEPHKAKRLCQRQRESLIVILQISLLLHRRANWLLHFN